MLKAEAKNHQLNSILHSAFSLQPFTNTFRASGVCGAGFEKRTVRKVHQTNGAVAPADGDFIPGIQLGNDLSVRAQDGRGLRSDGFSRG